MPLIVHQELFFGCVRRSSERYGAEVSIVEVWGASKSINYFAA